MIVKWKAVAACRRFASVFFVHRNVHVRNFVLHTMIVFIFSLE